MISTFSDLVLGPIGCIWVRSDAHDGKVCDFILEKGMHGLSARKIDGKLLLRAWVIGDIVMNSVEAGEYSLSPGGRYSGSPLIPE